MKIENGWHWRGPNCNEYISQWLDGDTWVLMTAPYQARHGGTAQMPTSNLDGKIFHTTAELATRLERGGYVHIDGRTIEITDR